MNTFTQPITQAYNLTDATGEIMIMLLVSFLLGWLFNHLWNSSTKGSFAKNTQSTVPSKYAGISQDDLKIVEGVGPKIEELLKAGNINSWKDMATAEVATLKSILKTGGDRFQMHDPSSWPDQAALAVEGKWADLEEYQDLLVGGRG